MKNKLAGYFETDITKQAMVEITVENYLNAIEHPVNPGQKMEDIVNSSIDMMISAKFKQQLNEAWDEVVKRRQEYNAAVENFDVEIESQKVIKQFKELGVYAEAVSFGWLDTFKNHSFEDSRVVIAKVMCTALETNKWPEVFDKVVCSVSEGLLQQKLHGGNTDVNDINEKLYAARRNRKESLLLLKILFEHQKAYAEDGVEVNKVVTDSNIQSFQKRGEALRLCLKEIELPIEFDPSKEAKKYVKNLRDPNLGMQETIEIINRAYASGGLNALNYAIQEELLNNPKPIDAISASDARLPRSLEILAKKGREVETPFSFEPFDGAVPSILKSIKEEEKNKIVAARKLYSNSKDAAKPSTPNPFANRKP